MSPIKGPKDTENLPPKAQEPHTALPRSALASVTDPARHSRSKFSFDGQLYAPLEPNAAGWPQLGPDSATGVGPTAQKWAAQQRYLQTQ